MNRWLVLVLAVGCAAAWAQEPVVPRLLHPDAPLPDIKLDVDLGERTYSPKEEASAAAEVLREINKDPHSRSFNDARVQARVEAIGWRIITAAKLVGPKQIPLDTPGHELAFTFHVLDSPDINAFSVWNGNIFLSKALIDFCQSDDELAGIMGHECAHSMFHHLREQTRRAQQYNILQVLTTAAVGILSHDIASAGFMAQAFYMALFTGHTVDEEAQADWGGCYYAYRAGYNPVGLMTTMERLYRIEMASPMPKDIGMLKDHPWSDQRARSLELQIRSLGLPINRREVTAGLTSAVRLDPLGKAAPALLLGDFPLLTVAAAEGQSAERRAAGLALTLNRALADNPRSSTLDLVADGAAWTIRGRGRGPAQALLTITAADAALTGEPLDSFADKVFRRFQARLRQAELELGT